MCNHATALTSTTYTVGPSSERSARDYARRLNRSQNYRQTLERKLIDCANWKSSHHQSFQSSSAGISLAVEALWDSTDGSAEQGLAMPIGDAPCVKHLERVRRGTIRVDRQSRRPHRRKGRHG